MRDIDSLVTIMVAVAGSGGLWGTLQLILNRQGRRAEAAKAQAIADKSIVTRAQLLAQAQALAQKTALDSAHEAYESVRAQCDACTKRLAVTESRLRRAEEREDTIMEVLRTLVLVLDAADPTGIDAAVAAARKLV